MATDATGTPTSLGIPKINTSADAPSGLGFNAAMDSIDTLLTARVTKPAGIVSGEVPVWNGSTWIRSTASTATLGGNYPSAEIGYEEIATTFSTAAASEVAAATVVSSGTITYDGSPVIIEFYAPRFFNTAVTNLFIVLFDGTNPIGQLAQLNAPTTGTPFGVGTLKTKLTPSAGGHTYAIKAWTGAGTVSIDAGARGPGAFMPAYIRVTRA